MQDSWVILCFFFHEYIFLHAFDAYSSSRLNQILKLSIQIEFHSRDSFFLQIRKKNCFSFREILRRRNKIIIPHKHLLNYDVFARNSIVFSTWKFHSFGRKVVIRRGHVKFYFLIRQNEIRILNVYFNTREKPYWKSYTARFVHVCFICEKIFGIDFCIRCVHHVRCKNILNIDNTWKRITYYMNIFYIFSTKNCHANLFLRNIRITNIILKSYNTELSLK